MRAAPWLALAVLAALPLAAPAPGEAPAGWLALVDPTGAVRVEPLPAHGGGAAASAACDPAPHCTTGAHVRGGFVVHGLALEPGFHGTAASTLLAPGAVPPAAHVLACAVAGAALPGEHPPLAAPVCATGGLLPPRGAAFEHHCAAAGTHLAGLGAVRCLLVHS